MITLLLSFILFVFAVATLLKRRNSDPSSHDLDRIPGPTRLPMIGNLHLFLSKSPPHHIFRDLAVKYGPLMRLQMGEVPFLFVSSVEVASQVLKTHDVVFANRPHIAAAGPFTYNCTNIGFSPYGEHWRQLRRIATLELLSARRVRYFRPIREEENADVAEWVASHHGSPANLTERIYQSSFDITSRAAFGQEPEEKRTLMSAVDEIMKLGSGFSLADLYPSNSLLLFATGLHFKIQRLFRLTDRIMENIIKQHRVVPATGAGAGAGPGERSEDLADVLLKCQQDDGHQMRLTDDNIKAVIMVTFR